MLTNPKKLKRDARRRKEAHSKRLAEALEKGISFEIPDSFGFEDGDIFTLSGHKFQRDGTLIQNCKPGEETIIYAKNTKGKLMAICYA